jgi:hypothetical protein
MRSDNFFSKSLFQPSIVRSLQGQNKKSNITLASTSDLIDEQENKFTSDYNLPFFYDQTGTPLKNSQQLNLDFSKFENHTFFNSARVKTQIAIQKIINKFPFDGKKIEYENFINNLNGYEKYVLDSFPKQTNYLIFNSSYQQYIEIEDFKGSKSDNETELDKKFGTPVLDMNLVPLTFEFYLWLPNEVNDNMIICQRLVNSSNGITIGIKENNNINDAEAIFIITSNNQELILTVPIKKGEFNHLAFIYDRNNDAVLECLVNGTASFKTNNSVLFNSFNFLNEKLTIGYGLIHETNNFNFVPGDYLNAAIDEFRFFNTARSKKLINKYKNKNIFSEESLKLYFRFNEPNWEEENQEISNLVLDYSGNGLHSKIINYNDDMRKKINLLDVPLKAENPELSPILFLNFSLVKNFINNLLLVAENYDINNPNLITKMVPPHYLTEAAYSEGLDLEEEYLSKSPNSNNLLPETVKYNKGHVMSSILFTWAEVFDDIKIFIDELGRLLKVDYIDDKTISNHLIPFLANYQGFNLPLMFGDNNLNQYLQGEGLTLEESRSAKSIQDLQNIIWKRILSDLVEIRKTKGTINSLNSVLRNIGLNPNGSFRIKEYGGSNVRYINETLEKRESVSKMLNFSDLSNQAFIKTPFLINETGKFFTSESWTYEAIYKLTPNNGIIQSLVNLQTINSNSDINVVCNIVAIAPTKNNNFESSIVLYLNFKNNTTISTKIENINVFDGNKWYISFGREKHDGINKLGSTYFIRAAQLKLDNTQIIKESKIELFESDEELNHILIEESNENINGPYIVIGENSNNFNESYLFNAISPEEGKILNFNNKINNIRFFTKFLNLTEANAHITNFKSAGVENPKLNYNFVDESKSFEKIRFEYTMEQESLITDNQGKINIFDFSQNNFVGLGENFEPLSLVIVPEKFYYNTINPKLENNSNQNKVRIRSFLDTEKVLKYNANFAPLFELSDEDQPNDDRRIEVEISLVQALNDDIATIFSSLDAFNNYIGAPELVFSREYKELRNLRKIYFNRLTDKINIKNFFEFFKWFDDTVGDVLEQLIPYNSKYLGTNFIIESHALERPKFTYSYQEMYLGEIDRRPTSTLYLQQFLANIRKF